VHFVVERKTAEGRGEWIFRDCTGSHVVFPLEDPLLPCFRWSPAHALIWSLLRAALMLRHCWNYAAPSFSPPPHIRTVFVLWEFGCPLMVLPLHATACSIVQAILLLQNTWSFEQSYFYKNTDIELSSAAIQNKAKCAYWIIYSSSMIMKGKFSFSAEVTKVHPKGLVLVFA